MKFRGAYLIRYGFIHAITLYEHNYNCDLMEDVPILSRN